MKYYRALLTQREKNVVKFMDFYTKQRSVRAARELAVTRYPNWTVKNVKAVGVPSVCV